tara:strand:- start:688 stop:1368 length:681 start_codon:yes stop_codon:yes gene_type:complete
MKKIIYFFLSFSSLLFSQTENNRIINIGEFYSLKVYSGIHIKLVPSIKNKLVIFDDKGSDVIVVTKNGVIKIRHSIDNFLDTSPTYAELNYIGEINKIFTYQGSKVEMNDLLETKQLNITAKEGSEVDIKIKVNFLSSQIATGAKLKIRGKAKDHVLKISKGGVCEAENLFTENTDVKLSIGGRAHIRVSNKISANSRIGGAIRVFGNPKIKNFKTSLGGSIIEMK